MAEGATFSAAMTASRAVPLRCRLLLLLLRLLLTAVPAAPQPPQYPPHPHVGPELSRRGYDLCLDIVLNGRSKTLRLEAGLDSTGAARRLLLEEDGVDQGDDIALATMVGWVESRTALKLLVRLDLRQRLRRSASPPQLVLTSGGCRRAGALDVQTATLGSGNRHANHNQHPSYRHPWVISDFSALNPHDARDWAWVLRGRAALQRLVVPLETLRDVLFEQLMPQTAPEALRAPEAAQSTVENGACVGDAETCPEEVDLEDSEGRGLLRAVKAVAMAARPHLRAGASLTLALPYCGPADAAPWPDFYDDYYDEEAGGHEEEGAGEHEDEDGAETFASVSRESRRRLCEDVVAWFASPSGTWANDTAAVSVRHFAESADDRMLLVKGGRRGHGQRSGGADEEEGIEEDGLVPPSRRPRGPQQRLEWSAGTLALAAWGRSGVGPTDRGNQEASEGRRRREAWTAIDVDLASTAAVAAAVRGGGGGGGGSIVDDDTVAAAAVTGAMGGGAMGGGAMDAAGVATLVINLRRRPDRWRALQAQVQTLYPGCAEPESGSAAPSCAARPPPLQLERVDAVDGRLLFHSVSPLVNASAAAGGTGAGLTPEQWDAQWLTSNRAVGAQFNLDGWSYPATAGAGGLRASALNPHPDHGWRPTVIGCALSHLRTWRRIARTAFDDVDDLHVLHFLDAKEGGAAAEESRGGNKKQRHRRPESYGEAEEWRPWRIGRGSHKEGSSASQEPAAAAAAAAAAAVRGDMYRPFLVLEDDAVLSADFAERFAETMAVAAQDFSWDVLFLGALDDRDLYGDSPAAFSCSARAPTSSSSSSSASSAEAAAAGEGGISVSGPGADFGGLRCLLREVSTSGRTFGSGLFAYVLRPRGARALLHAAATAGPIMQPIDWWVWEKLAANAFSPPPPPPPPPHYDASPPVAEQPEGARFVPSVFDEGGAGGGADARHLHRLVGLKASPALASSPEGQGRDSDNDEAYSPARFLRAANGQGEGGGSKDEEAVHLMVRQPRPGTVLRLGQAAAGEGLVEVELVVGGPSNLFLETHKHSLVCVQVNEAPDPKTATTATTKDGPGGDLGAPFDASRASCRTLDDAHLFLPPVERTGHYQVTAFLVDSGIGGSSSSSKELNIIADSLPRRFKVSDGPVGDPTIDKALADASISEERSLYNKRQLKIIQEALAEEDPRSEKEKQTEVVSIEVVVDEKPQIVQWHPAHEKVFFASRAFCVDRVNLHDVESAALCMDQIVTALLDKRREAYKSRRRQPAVKAVW